MSKVQDIRKSSLTFAPEAGSQRMRNVINKGLTEEDIMNGAGQAFEGGWTKVKLYFMLGLPRRDGRRYERNCTSVRKGSTTDIMRFRKNSVMANVRLQQVLHSLFRKPFTPFQWAPMCTAEEYIERAAYCKT